MTRTRSHPRLLSAAAFTLLLLAAEVAGHGLTRRVDRLLHVRDPLAGGGHWYPFLLLGAKAGAALLAARIAWRLARAHATAHAGRRLLRALGGRPGPAAPRVRVRLSPRLWAAAFGLTAALYLLQADLHSRSATLAPWLHTYALPVFAVLAVLVALGWGIGCRFVADYESYAEETLRRVRGLARTLPPARRLRPAEDTVAPRRRFGLAFESRPPPVPA